MQSGGESDLSPESAAPLLYIECQLTVWLSGPYFFCFGSLSQCCFWLQQVFSGKALKIHITCSTLSSRQTQRQAGDHGGVFSSWRARYFEGRKADPKESEYWTYICQVAEVLLCFSAITVCVKRPLFANKFDDWRWWHQCCVHCQQGACLSKWSHKCDGQLWQHSINYWQPHRLQKEGMMCIWFNTANRWTKGLFTFKFIIIIITYHTRGYRLTLARGRLHPGQADIYRPTITHTHIHTSTGKFRGTKSPSSHVKIPTQESNPGPSWSDPVDLPSC